MRLINALKQIKARDISAPFIFLILLIPSLTFRLINLIKGRKLWLIAEQGDARDNGYHFYKYIRLNHPNDYCFYAINKESAGYQKVSELGNIIKWGSLKHWFYYMSANLNISSQKSGNPCPIFWYVMHVTFGLYKNRVFLQHGITKDDSKWIYYNKTKFKYFVCGAKREYDYILKKFGYKKENLLLTGFPRWDNLKDTSKNQKNKSILIMPTWRNWLGGDRNDLFKVKDFENTEFFKHWNGLLNNKEFVKYIEDNKITVYFYPHVNMMKFIKSFKPGSKNIEIVSLSEDIQNFFCKCDLMITDYSSVAFDFAYLRKPVIYYQFDYEEYRKKQYQEGYFDYKKDGFGPVVCNIDDIVGSLENVLLSNAKYKVNIKKMFGNKDINNSRMLYCSLTDKEYVNDGDKKISIIIPVYNGEKYIEKCLNQITTQKYENIEIIVIDDGSSDDTINIIMNYSKEHQCIKLFRQDHAGPNAARKKGVKEATGDIILFVDSDDYIADGSLSKLVQYFNNNNVDAIRFSAKCLPSCKVHNKMSINGTISHDDIIRILLTTYKLNCLWAQAYKAEVVKKCKDIDYGISLGEDLLFNLEIHKNTRNMLIVDDVMYYYCDNNNSTTRNRNMERVINNLRDRVFASCKVIEYSRGEKIDYHGEIIYKQVKMIRDYILNLYAVDRKNKKHFLEQIKNVILPNQLTEYDKKKMNEYISSCRLLEKIKNKKIVLSIVSVDCKYIWLYSCVMWRLNRITRRGGR